MKVAPKRRYHGLPRFTPANVASWLLHSPNDSPCPLLQPLKGAYGDKKPRISSLLGNYALFSS